MTDQSAPEHAGIGRQNLAATFGTRTAGAGKLAPRRPAAAPESVVDVRQSASTAQSAPESPSKPSEAEGRPERPARKTAKKTTAPAAATGARSQIIVYLPIPLAERLRTAGEQ